MTDITYRPEAPADAALILALTDRAFGPGRYAKAAERLREGNALIAALSISAWRGEALLGSVRMWPVRVGDGVSVFLGPIAVEADERKHGIGAELVERACAAARTAGWQSVFLVGDAPYFGRMGFEVAPGLKMPGPVDRRRVLWKALSDGAGAPEGLARV
ncbi:MAG: N-acetyltransferase [Caulobacteraceae bacterium]|nr:MAG: N-acetyltransferase [Caulobacteraceae bacterium]